MKHELEIWYLVSDGGDGSAYPRFYESKECTELADEILLYQGANFAETCNGSIKLESDSPITCLQAMTTMEEVVSEFKEKYHYFRRQNNKVGMDNMLPIAEMYNIDLTFNPEID